MGGGRSGRRPQPEPAQAAVPLDHREFADPAGERSMAEAVDADGDQHTSEAEVPVAHGHIVREGAIGAVETESRVSDFSGACPVTQHPLNTSAPGNICELFVVARMNILVRRNSARIPVHGVYALIELT